MAEGAQLVGVVDVHGHRGGQELDRIIGLHVGRLVGDHGIGGGVGLVEAVAGELGHLIEDVGGLGRGHPARRGAVDEGLALLGHFRLDLLAHGAAQKVGVAEGEAGQFLGDLHDLFLVDHDAEGFLEDAFQGRVQIVRFLLAALAFDVTGDVLHGPRAVERHHGDDVLEGVEPELAQHLAHAGAFQLEHAGGLAAPQHPEGEGVVQGQVREVDVDAPFADQLHGPGQHGQGLETQKIELHQPRQFHVFHAEAGHRHVRARVAVKRDQLVQRTVADDQAGGVGGGVAIQPLQPAGDIDKPGNGLVALHHPAELGLPGDGPVQGDRIGGIEGHQLADAVDQGIGHLQDPAHVAQDRARLQLAEGDDLGHVVVAVLVLHVVDDFVPALLTEVDIEVGHGNPLGI